ncbi:hypothetical protein F5Y11DRAFT_348630 [Daldinia sp. FL1419]|nr:hypothetical protein F5Y11DRAFT_348630 [Daldinia sp. FL1419]
MSESRLAARPARFHKALPEVEDIGLRELNLGGTLNCTSSTPLPAYSELGPYPQDDNNAPAEATETIVEPNSTRLTVDLAMPPPADPFTRKGCLLIQLDCVIFTHCQPYIGRAFNYTESRYKWIAAMREAGHVTFQVPFNLFLSATARPSGYPCAILCAWGSIQLFLRNAYDSPSAFILYKIMGILELAVLPGFLYLFSCWCTKKSTGRHISLMVALWSIALFIISLVSIRTASDIPMDDIRKAYDNYSLISGAIAVISASLCYKLPPDLPRSTEWLSEAESYIVIYHLVEASGWPRPVQYEDLPSCEYILYSLERALIGAKIRLLILCWSGSCFGGICTDLEGRRD